MSVVVSHPTGAPFVRAVLRAAERAQLLDTFWTSFALPTAFSRLLPEGHGLRRELGRRTFGEVPWTKIRVRPQREALRIAARRLGFPGLVRHGSPVASVDVVYRHLDRAVAGYLRRSAPSAVTAAYAYEDGALETFLAAGEIGYRRIYELPIAYWRKLHSVLADEREASPEWANTIDGLRDGSEKLARKDAELESADLILVASSFTRSSVEEHFGATRPVVVVPYGAPAPYVYRPAERANDAPLEIIYAGHLDQRKGIGYLIEALNRLAIPWRATLAGAIPDGAPSALFQFLALNNVRYLGHVPHQTLLEAMANAHVFVFPSLLEGFAMVLTEAMAAGIPIITTPHTAGPDLIDNGVEGYIVPIRDPDTIAEKLTSLYEDEQNRLAMGTAALGAAAAHPWRKYEDTIVGLLKDLRWCSESMRGGFHLCD